MHTLRRIIAEHCLLVCESLSNLGIDLVAISKWIARRSTFVHILGGVWMFLAINQIPWGKGGPFGMLNSGVGSQTITP